MVMGRNTTTSDFQKETGPCGIGFKRWKKAKDALGKGLLLLLNPGFDKALSLLYALRKMWGGLEA